MNTKSNITKLIEQFSTDNLVQFFRSKARTFTQTDFVVSTDKADFTDGLQLGEFKTDISELAAYCFKVQKPLSERSGKKAQYELAKRILKQEQRYSAGIFVFYDDKGDFRFSLVYDILSAEGKRTWSNFRRFTYFVSKEQTNKTFIRQIGDADFSTLEKIKEAFSVEPISKQFYSEIQNWYFWAQDKIKFPDNYKYSNDPAKDKEIRNATNLIRLITRIIFIWFLKEKDLVPRDLFSKEKLAKIVRDFLNGKNASNFYNAILQNLFFATLNQKMNERKFADEAGFPANRKEYGVKNLYRYADKFLISKDEVLKLFGDIPFLNGGLFDCLDKEDETGKVIYVDGFSRNPAKQAIIPDYLFFQQVEEKVDLSQYGLGRNKPVRGLIEILNSYNFTIDENTPVDQEIALDPELLGKVFENLLASYNPETAITARKATGSYYTPREIVDYMVELSLVEYLKGKLPETEEEKIKILLSYSEENPAFSEEEKQKIISAVDEIKILDPACGSGAFPMGILHKLVFVLQKLDPENKYWYELQYQKALKETEEIFKQGDKNEREEKLKEINEVFDESINYQDYARKLYLIKNCIYGVDIQPIAVQISKLRFFISLVADQKVDRSKENFGIRALPNLETNFVAANALLDLNSNNKKKLEEKEGFDIVIGNPPYGASYSDAEKTYFKKNYQSAKTIPGRQKGSLDTFTLFIEKGFKILKRNGCLTFIVPMSITSSDSMTGIHNLLEANCEEIKISSYSVRPQPIFQNSVVNVSILSFVKTQTHCKRIFATKMYRKSKDFDLQRLLTNLQFIDVLNYKLNGRYPKISLEIETSILNKIFSQKTTIGELIRTSGKPIYYRTTGGRYFKVITSYSTGSTKEKSIFFDRKIANLIGAILSSNLYFWFYQIYSNNLDLKSYEIESFRIPIDKLNESVIKKIETIYEKYLEDIEKNANIRQTTRYTNIDSFKEYKIGKSKHIIDQIDDLIGSLYGLTKDEIEFVKNYEINFRMSDED